jgi:hypothetical protein
VGQTPGEAHESAIKEAETDAMKRALSTFGNPFGLALYDKEQQNVRGRRKKQPQSSPNGKDRAITWLVLSSEGEYLSSHEDPVDYCKAMRQLLEAISTRERLRSFWQRNLVTIAMLRRNLPDLKSDKGEHYAEILTSLYKQQMRVVWEEAKADERRGRKVPKERPGARKQVRDMDLKRRQTNAQASSRSDGEREGSKADAAEVMDTYANEKQCDGERQLKQRGANKSESPGLPQRMCAERETGAGMQTIGPSGNGATGHVDKTNLPINTPRRVRDKEHLRYVASQPCIICGRSPGQAHHLRFAQPRALGRKVSDEWTVPLCSTHHRALHSVGEEERWWKEKELDPIAHAVRLWWDTKHEGVEHQTNCAALLGTALGGRDRAQSVAKKHSSSETTSHGAIDPDEDVHLSNCQPGALPTREPSSVSGSQLDHEDTSSAITQQAHEPSTPRTRSYDR